MGSDFALGLIVNLTNNTTSGINDILRDLQRLTQEAVNTGNSLRSIASLSAFSDFANQMGDAMIKGGTVITGTFSKIINKINETGQTLKYAESQMDKLYEGSGKSGKDVLNEITDYAKKSTFEFENLIPVVTMLKANGIEAFDKISSSTGKANQTLMDYASDLAAFNPQMRNAYGKGIQAAMGALNEYIAEGNAKSLKSGASLDITALLGEDKGKTIEERSRQVADLMEKLNMVGMTAQMAESPMTKLSNMGDTLFQFMGMVANSGVYDKFNEIINIFAETIADISESDLEQMAKTVGEALSGLLEPLKQVAKFVAKAAKGFFDFTKNNPTLAKFVTIAIGMSGVMLVLGGVSLKFLAALGRTGAGLRDLGATFQTIGGVLRLGATKIIAVFVPLMVAMGILYLTWKSNLFGIRTMVTNFVGKISQSFKTAKTAVSGSLEQMRMTLNNFDTRHSFFDGLTVSIMKVMVLGKALSEAWNGYTLSEDTYKKAEELGILPLIERILDLKYRFELFAEGFKKGWDDIVSWFDKKIKEMQKNSEGTIFESMFKSLEKFFDLLSSGDASAWKDFGEKTAYVVVAILGLILVLNIVTGVLGLLSGIVTIVTGALTILSGIATVVGGAFTVISNILGFFLTPLGAIIGLVASVGIAIASFVDMFVHGFSWVKEILMIVGIALAAVFAVILGAPILIAAAVAGIIAAIATIAIIIKDNWDKIVEFVMNLGASIKEGLDNAKASFMNWANGVKAFWGNVFNNIGNTVSTALENVKSSIKSKLDGALNIVKGIVDKIRSVFNFKWSLPELKLPHVSVSGGKPPFGIGGMGSLPKFDIKWFENGGVFGKPSLIGVGENGKEAVMPLEKNTGWIDSLAGTLANKIGNADIIPSKTGMNTSEGNSVETPQYLTRTNSGNTGAVGNTNNNNSINISEGAIQINCANASEEEARRMAKIIMEEIKRKQELEGMLKYNYT